MQEMKYGKEGEVYRLTMKSKLPDAEKFQDWVCDEVLPSIRKTGGYMISKPEDTPEELMARALLVAQDALRRREERIANLEQQTALQSEELQAAAPKVNYYEKVLQSTSTYNTNQIAKELGMSAVTLNQKLREMGVQYKQGGQWLLTTSIKTRTTREQGHIHTSSVTERPERRCKPYGRKEDGSSSTVFLT